MTLNRYIIRCKVTYSAFPVLLAELFIFVDKYQIVRYLIIVMLILGTLGATAQKVLVVEKVGRGRYFTYREGDIIRLMTNIGHFRIEEEIVQVNDSSILVKGNYQISFRDISYIEKVYRSRKGNGILLMIAGGALVAITSINNGLHRNQVLDPLFLSIGAGLAGTGGFWYSMGKRKYRIGEKWKLKALDGFLR